MRAQIIRDLSSKAYHADPCPVPSLSQSLAHKMINGNPAKAYLAHPKLGGEPFAPTATMEWGSLIHSLVLGVGSEYEVVDAPDYRTKAAQAARDTIRLSGKVPVLPHDLAEAQTTAKALRDQIAELGFTFDGDSELSIQWTETPEGSEDVVHCRARLDHLCADGTTILDLKTTSNARPDQLGRHMVDYGYDIQSAAYLRALEATNPDLAGRCRFVFLFAETEPPYSVVAAIPDGVMSTLGQMKWERAVELWAECLRTGIWPHYTKDVARVSPPPWELTRFGMGV